MSVGEAAYLTLVIAAFLTFMGGVAFVSWYSRPRTDATQAKASAQVGREQAGFKKAA